MNDDTLKFKLPQTPPPPWREFKNRANREAQAKHYIASEQEVKLVNAALMLRRPLLITGAPGVGKSSLAYAVAHQLELGEVLQWSITSKSVRQDGLYQYDALARLQEAALLEKYNASLDDVRYQAARRKVEDIGRYITLGPLGTAFLRATESSEAEPAKPCVVLIDELDKSDVDLPNDLLHLFEDGEFEIPEIARLPDSENLESVTVYAYNSHDKLTVPRAGKVCCKVFPLVVITSNGERQFPPAFLRRCLRLHIPQPNETKLRDIVMQHLQLTMPAQQHQDLTLEQHASYQLLQTFLARRSDKHNSLATDQLLSAMYLLQAGENVAEDEDLQDMIFQALSE